jgi:ATP-binding cassette subfamily C protein CydC
MKDLLRLLGLLRPYARSLAAGVALNVVVVLSNVGLLALSGWFIAAMALAGLGRVPIEYFAPAAAIRGLAIVRTAGRYLERLVTHDATFRLLSGLRVWLYGHLEPLAPARLQAHRGGDLLSRVRSDVDSLDNLYLRVIAPTTAALICVVALVGFLALFSVPAAWILAAGLLASGVLLPLLAQRLGRGPGVRAVSLRAELRANLSDGVGGLGELLIAGAEGRQAATASELGGSLMRQQRRQARIGSVANAISGLASRVALWGALVVSIPLVRAGELSGPDLAMVGLFVLASFEAVAALPAAWLALGETLAASRRVFELVDAVPAIDEPRAGVPRPAHLSIRIRDLRMRYADDGPWALYGIGLDLAEGGSLGIVGPSGAGKTSLFNVLLRFWEYEGEVSIGGVPLRDLHGEVARGLFGVVSQRAHLFNRSVRENLLLARPGASDAELMDALRAAHLEDDIARLPAGLDTLAGENGARFSGGQARRLAIARALLKDAPILLLDEPTEGLDAASEGAVLDALAALKRGRTTILITHRSSALRIVDTVVSIEHGRLRVLKAVA